MGNVDSLKTYLNEITTYLSEGEIWHRRAMTECNLLGLRGFGRWHSAESCEDEKHNLCLSKLVADCPMLMYTPDVDTSVINRAFTYKIGSMSAFKEHFNQWIAREKRFVDCLNKAIDASRDVDIKLYKDLCCITEEVQEEIKRVGMLIKRLEIGDWVGHDLAIVSASLHEHFEAEHGLDFNLG